MAHRYAFWKSPNGKPYRRNDDKYTPTSLLDRIGIQATLKDGGISWPGGQIDVFEEVISASVVAFDCDCNQLCAADTCSLVWNSICKCVRDLGGQQPILPSRFLKTLDTLVADFLRLPIVDYTCVKYLSVKQLPARRITVDQCVVRPISDRRFYPLPDCFVLKEKTGIIADHLHQSPYSMIAVDIQDRSVNGAISKVNQGIDLLRGLWNLFATYRAKSITLGGIRRYPVGVIHAGAVQTLHFRDGTPVDNVYWYDPDMPPVHKLYPRDSSDSTWLKIEKERHWANNRLRELPYAKDLKELLCRYACALDNTNLDLACLQLWSILEKATDTVGSSYDETIERTTWGSSEKRLLKQLLEFLRLRRNEYVHAASSSGDRQHATYLLKDFVDQHLVRLLRNDFEIGSLAEYAEFLSLPTNLAKLRLRAERIDQAIKFYEGKSAADDEE